MSRSPATPSSLRSGFWRGARDLARAHLSHGSGIRTRPGPRVPRGPPMSGRLHGAAVRAARSRTVAGTCPAGEASMTAAPHRFDLPAVGAARRSSAPTAPAFGLGGSPVGAFSIPFLPFDIEPFGSEASAGTLNTSGLVARGDGHTIGEGKAACPNRGGTDQYRNRVR
jgi:hypothetical protein